MLPKRLFNLFVVLFPVVYLIHNAEEWYVFDLKVSSILNIIPFHVKGLIPNDPIILSSMFGIAVIVATIIPVIVALFILNKNNALNVKILLVIAFVTLINALSHISSTIGLGFISPGFITGILLCLPYSILLIFYIKKFNKFALNLYVFLGVGSIIAYIVGVAICWLMGMLLISV